MSCPAACFSVLPFPSNARYHFKYHRTRYRYDYTRFVRTTLLIHNKCTPSSQLSSASQRRAVPCGGLPCLTVRCCAVLRCALFRAYSARYHAKYQVPVTTPFAPVACQVILEPGIGQFREVEPRRVHTRINSSGLFLVHKLTCGKRDSVS